jgi:hypothetical protein
MRPLVLATALLAVLAPQTTFRSGIDLVPINVSVQDGSRPVAGLQAADFEVLDNGVPQTITDVSADTLPIDIKHAAATAAEYARRSERVPTYSRVISPISKISSVVQVRITILCPRKLNSRVSAPMNSKPSKDSRNLGSKEGSGSLGPSDESAPVSTGCDSVDWTGAASWLNSPGSIEVASLGRSGESPPSLSTPSNGMLWVSSGAWVSLR